MKFIEIPKLVALLLGLPCAGLSQGQQVVVLHAPSTISQAEYSRLQSLIGLKIVDGSELVETPNGDILIRVKGLGFFVVSKDSELVSPVRILRELFALANKYGEGKLIPISELSENSQSEYRRKIYEQYPQYDISPSSCFTLQAMLQRDVRSMGAIVRTATAPSKFNSADKVDKQKTYNDMLSSAPLIRARTEEEAIELRNKLPWLRESVYYDNFSQMVTKLTLERRGLELFQSWMQIELEKVDQKIQSKFSADKSWSAITQGRSSKNADDLMRISLTEYQELRSRFEDGYKSFHFSTAQDALDALGKAQISYRFIFTLRAGLQGLDRRFIFDPQG